MNSIFRWIRLSAFPLAIRCLDVWHVFDNKGKYHIHMYMQGISIQYSISSIFVSLFKNECKTKRTKIVKLQHFIRAFLWKRKKTYSEIHNSIIVQLWTLALCVRVCECVCWVHVCGHWCQKNTHKYKRMQDATFCVRNNLQAKPNCICTHNYNTIFCFREEKKNRENRPAHTTYVSSFILYYVFLLNAVVDLFFHFESEFFFSFSMYTHFRNAQRYTTRFCMKFSRFTSALSNMELN